MPKASKAPIQMASAAGLTSRGVGVFYPSDLPHKRELEYMSRKLTWIEVNGTFYRGQSRDSYAKSRDETPDGFVFALKGRATPPIGACWPKTRKSIERFVGGGVTELGDKLGPINWQFSADQAFRGQQLRRLS